jgi:biopolymer transport protein ExbB/TolQ
LETGLNVLGLLENGLFALGQVLRLPVIVLLWVCVAAGLFLAGACVVEAVSRRRERRKFSLNTWLRSGPVLQAASRTQSLPTPLKQLLGDIERARGEGMLAAGGLEHVVLVREEQVRRSLVAPRMLVKVGPSLGLLGTLIPMGSSLASLAAGNLDAMAGQMVIAFTTTIVGLATGTLAFVVAAVRQNWVNETVHEQRYLADRIASELGQEA